MRTRRVRNSEKALRRVADPAQVPPGRLVTLRDLLLDAGVPEHAVASVEAIAHQRSLWLAATHLRDIFDRLDRNPAGVALRRAIMGGEGLTLQESAELAGCDRSNLYHSEQRIRKRLRLPRAA